MKPVESWGLSWVRVTNKYGTDRTLILFHVLNWFNFSNLSFYSILIPCVLWMALFTNGAIQINLRCLNQTSSTSLKDQPLRPVSTSGDWHMHLSVRINQKFRKDWIALAILNILAFSFSLSTPVFPGCVALTEQEPYPDSLLLYTLIIPDLLIGYVSSRFSSRHFLIS